MLTLPSSPFPSPPLQHTRSQAFQPPDCLPIATLVPRSCVVARSSNYRAVLPEASSPRSSKAQLRSYAFRCASFTRSKRGEARHRTGQRAQYSQSGRHERLARRERIRCGCQSSGLAGGRRHGEVWWVRKDRLPRRTSHRARQKVSQDRSRSFASGLGVLVLTQGFVCGYLRWHKGCLRCVGPP